MSNFPSGPGSAPPAAPPTDPTPAPAAKPPADPAPAATYWDVPVPAEGLPDVFKPFAGKTPNEIAASHKELRALSSNQGSRIKDLEGNLSTAQDALKAAQDGQVVDEVAAAQQETRALWQQSVREYWQNQGGNDEMIGQLAEKTGLSRQDVLDVHENFLSKRNSFLSKAEADFPKIDVPVLEGWIQAGESGFNDGMMEAFYFLADEGYTGWLEVVQAKYDKFIEGGGRPTGQSGLPGTNTRHPLSRGKPPAAEAGGFVTRDEYQTAYRDAVNSGDDAEKAKVMAKLELSDKAKW